MEQQPLISYRNTVKMASRNAKTAVAESNAWAAPGSATGSSVDGHTSSYLPQQNPRRSRGLSSSGTTLVNSGPAILRRQRFDLKIEVIPVAFDLYIFERRRGRRCV